MANSDPLIGKQVGNYHILAEINSGSFGSVYRGKHIIFEDDPVVAIKLLHASLHTQQEHTEFIKEAQLLKKLRHPYILRILDAGFQENMPYLVTEYAAGGSLRDRLRKYNGHPLPVEEAVAILTQIGQALHYANQQHIVHRDLKPENILFNNQGEALLADFGIAVLLTTAHTRRVGLGGTPPYMAPEQFEGLASPKSDQYALGCIAYELVTGHRLFSIPNPSLEAYWYHHVKVEPVPPTHFHPQLPTHIEHAILTALAKDRAQRHTDVSAFTKALTKGSEGWLDEAKTHLNAKRYEEALVACEHAIRLDPNNAWAYNIKGATLFSLQRYQEALVAFEQAIRLDPSYAAAYSNKGGVLNNLKRYEEALATCEQAIHLDPNFTEAYSNKGNALNNLKQYQEALVAYEQAIHLDPNFTEAYSNKSIALNNLKRYEFLEDIPVTLVTSEGSAGSSYQSGGLRATTRRHSNWDEDYSQDSSSSRETGRVFGSGKPQVNRQSPQWTPLRTSSSQKSSSNVTPSKTPSMPVRPKGQQYKAGDRVRHDKFGDGIVLKSAMEQDTEFVEVQFPGKHGKKVLNMDFAKLDKI